MHISDGILPVPVLVLGWVATSVIAGVAMRRIEGEALPKTAVMTSVFFTASLIHIPIGPTSVHLMLNGLVGVILGRAAFPAILLGVALQTLLFQHGGVTVIGINAVIMGLPAMVSYGLFRLRRFFPGKSRETFFGFIAGASATLLSGVFLAFLLTTAGESFLPAAKIALAAHFPIMVIEGVVTAVIVSFLARVKPDLLATDTATPLERF